MWSLQHNSCTFGFHKIAVLPCIAVAGYLWDFYLPSSSSACCGTKSEGQSCRVRAEETQVNVNCWKQISVTITSHVSLKGDLKLFAKLSASKFYQCTATIYILRNKILLSYCAAQCFCHKLLEWPHQYLSESNLGN